MPAQDLPRRAMDTLSRRPVAAAISTTAFLLSLTWTYRDFQAWKDFGSGGLPPNPKGYLIMSVVRLMRLLSWRSLTNTSGLRTDGPKYLTTPLQTREGPRPKIMARTMPQRQQPDPNMDPEVKAKILGMVARIGAEHPELLVVDLSKTEGRSTDAIYARKDLPTLNKLASNRILDHEIAHAHPVDRSLHIWLADADAKAVVDAGWGQRFPLPFVASGWTMVYAPRTMAEVDVIEKIVRAGVGWLTGVAI